MLQDSVKATGELTITVWNPDGSIKEERTIKNLVVTSGLNWLASRSTGSPDAMSHMAVGSGTNAAALANTALQTEVARVALVSASTTNNVTSYTAPFAAGVGTGAITEAGIFNAASAGTMLNRAVFPVVNKGALDTMAITWTVTQQ